MRNLTQLAVELSARCAHLVAVGISAKSYSTTSRNNPGCDPKDRGCCSVLYVPDLDSPLEQKATGDGEAMLSRINVSFRPAKSLPSPERSQVSDLSLDESEAESYAELRESIYSGLPKHQIGGFPFPVQGDDMELESQLVSNGLYCGDSSGYEDPRAHELRAGAADWRLLLQLDTDVDANVMWGDCGTLYFWVRAEEASRGRFENTWLILQCG